MALPAPDFTYDARRQGNSPMNVNQLHEPVSPQHRHCTRVWGLPLQLTEAPLLFSRSRVRVLVVAAVTEAVSLSEWPQ